MNKERQIFSTRDVYLASTLLTLGFEMDGVDFQIEGQRQLPVGYFNFKNTAELQATEKDYWQGKITVEPRIFIVNMRGLKAQISNIYKNPHQDFSKFKKKENKS